MPAFHISSIWEGFPLINGKILLISKSYVFSEHTFAYEKFYLGIPAGLGIFQNLPL